MVLERVSQLRQTIEEELKNASSISQLEEMQVRYLGKKGPISSLMQNLRDATAEERPQLGQTINQLKEWAQTSITERLEQLKAVEELARLEQETVDVTLPGRRPRTGRQHPVKKMIHRLLHIFEEMGFSVQYGPEVESDYYNFEALNFPANHPARDEHDTYYIRPDILLRTHTSPTQIRVMEHHNAPIRVVAPGLCFRNEDITARSHVAFHQIEGFYIDKQVSFADLMHTLQEFINRFFEKEVETRFRPSYFPFVEPGLEVDAACLLCSGSGCAVCKETGWLEILGAGMIHPEVLKAGGIDPEEYTGYAWGLGIERLVMLAHSIHDIRLFTDNDLRFLTQFS